jgi:hypothetical protein
MEYGHKIDGTMRGKVLTTRVTISNPESEWAIYLKVLWNLSRNRIRYPLSQKRTAVTGVGQTSSLHYYYLAFVVLTYLASLIGVNTSYRSSLGSTDPGIQALIALDWLFGER